MATRTQIINGHFKDLEGNALANGYLLMRLSQDSQISGSGQLASKLDIKVPLDVNGNVSGTVLVWGTDIMSPANSYYRVWGYKSNGQLVWGPNNQQITTGATFDLTNWVPNQVSNLTPASTPILLQTNEVNNGSQATLDLHASGGSMTVTDNGAGRDTIDGPTLKIGGVNAGNQKIWNLAAGTSIVLTDNGNGNLSITDLASPDIYGQYERISFFDWEDTVNVAESLGNGSWSSFSFGSPFLIMENAGVFSPNDPAGAIIGVSAGAGNLSFAFVSSEAGECNPVQCALHQYGFLRCVDDVSTNNFLRVMGPFAWHSANANWFATNNQDPLVTVGCFGIGFYVYTTGSAINWKAFSTNNGVTTSVDTGVKVDTTPHVFEWFVDKALSKITYKIDSNVVANITTNIPASGTLLQLASPGMQYEGPTGAVQAWRLFISWNLLKATYN